MSINQVLGRWGLYPWWPEDAPSLIHPDDLEALRAFFAYGKVFHCSGEDPPFITLVHGSHEFRVKPSLFQPVPTPAYTVGQSIQLTNGGQLLITECNWHDKKNAPFFHITLDGKKKSKRYFEEDLRSLIAETGKGQ